MILGTSCCVPGGIRQEEVPGLKTCESASQSQAKAMEAMCQICGKRFQNMAIITKKRSGI